MPRAGPSRHAIDDATLIGAGAVLGAVIWSLVFAGVSAAQDANRVVIEGTVKRGDEFTQDFGPGFTFRLRGRDVWAIVVTHAALRDRDLVYPVNPPYRFSNRLYIGPGYGESARESARNTPRELAFLYRPDDFAAAWDDLDRVLWPYGHAEAEVARATSELARFPTGTLKLEILSADYVIGTGPPRGASAAAGA